MELDYSTTDQIAAGSQTSSSLDGGHYHQHPDSHVAGYSLPSDHPLQEGNTAK